MNYLHKIMTLVPVRRNSYDIKNLKALFASEIIKKKCNQLFHTDKIFLYTHGTKGRLFACQYKVLQTVPNSKEINISFLALLILMVF